MNSLNQVKKYLITILYFVKKYLINSIAFTYLELCSSRPSASAEIDWVGIDDKEDDFCDDDSFALVNFDFVRCCV